ncbi:MAG: S9 family peptidase, partial [Sphingomonadales bacterium]
MRFWVMAAVSLAGMPAPVLAQDAETEATIENDRKFTSLDVFDLEYADTPRISPDGRYVLYTRRSNDIMTDRTPGALWLAAIDGSSNRLLQAGASGGEWSPSGDRIAYTDTDDTGRSAVFVRWMDSGQIERLAAMENGISNLAWSPDGQWLAFTSRVDADTKPLAKAPKKPDGAKWSEPVKVIDHARYRRDGQGFIDVTFSHVFVVPASGGTPRQLTSGDFDHDGPLAWTKDGRSILTSANRNEGWELETVEGDIWEVGVASASMRKVTTTGGSESAPVLSPDGSSIAFICQPNVKRPVWQVDLCVSRLDGSGLRNLTESLDREIADVRWTGRDIHFSFDDRGVRKVAKVSPAGGAIETVVEGLSGTSLGRPYLSGAYDVSANGTIAWTKGRHDRPADI